MPAFSAVSNNPLILFPSVSDMAMDFGFVNGLPGGSAGWSAGGSAAPTAVNGVGEQIGKAVHFVKTSGNDSYFYQNANCWTPHLLKGTGLNLYYYYRVRVVSYTGTPFFNARTDNYDSSGAYIGSNTNSFLQIGVDIPANNTWAIIRASAGTAIANAVGFTSQVGFTGADVNTCEMYCDWFAVGFHVNLADMGPARRGAFMDERFPLDTLLETRRQIAASGAVEQQAWNDGLKEVAFKTTAVDDTARTTIKGFTDQASQGVPFTVFLDQSDISGYNTILRARATQDSDGLSQIGRSPLHTWSYSCEEVAQTS